MRIMEREKADRPNNENSIRGLKMNEDFLEKEYYKILSDYVKIKLENDNLKKDIKNKNKCFFIANIDKLLIHSIEILISNFKKIYL